MSQSPLERARALQPAVRDAADEAERAGRLPASVAQAMAQAGLYRVGAPTNYGGGEEDPATQISVIEAISEADGSAGWNLMIGMENYGLLALGFPKGQQMFADPGTILAGSTAAVGRADAVPGGFEVTGEWQFASGVHNCHYFGALVLIHDDGKPREGELPRFMILPRAEIEIVENWNVAGMRGSGSHDVKIAGAFVPDEDVVAFLGGRETHTQAPIARFPRGSRLSYNKVGVALGIARAALDDFVAIATGKVPRFSGASLRERTLAQDAIAQAEARLRGARAFVMEAVTVVWEEVVAGREPTPEQRALLQIACSDAVRGCAEAVDLVCEAAGTTSNFLESPLERRARDVRVVRTHVTVAPHHLTDAGRVLLGLPPEGVMMNMV